VTSSDVSPSKKKKRALNLSEQRHPKQASSCGSHLGSQPNEKRQGPRWGGAGECTTQTQSLSSSTYYNGCTSRDGGHPPTKLGTKEPSQATSVGGEGGGSLDARPTGVCKLMIGRGESWIGKHHSEDRQDIKNRTQDGRSHLARLEPKWPELQGIRLRVVCNRGES